MLVLVVDGEGVDGVQLLELVDGLGGLGGHGRDGFADWGLVVGGWLTDDVDGALDGEGVGQGGVVLLAVDGRHRVAHQLGHDVVDGGGGLEDGGGAEAVHGHEVGAGG